MAADVNSCSSMVNSGNAEVLITKDLLGGLSQVVGNKDLDPDLQVHEAWEMPLDDLKRSGMVYRQRCSSPNTNLSSFNNKNHKQKATQKSEICNSNSPPFKFLEESCLELKLVTSSQYCQSVCTLEKVRSALQRAEKETSSTTTNKKRSSPPSLLTLSSAFKEDQDGDEKKSVSSSSPSTTTGVFAAACPGCLLYVITLKTNPKCPHCNSTVPFPLAFKKPRIDLNASL